LQVSAGDRLRQKQAVLFQMLATLHITSRPDDVWHTQSRAKYSDACAFKVVPLPVQAMTYEEMEYLAWITKQLFMHMSKPLSQSMRLVPTAFVYQPYNPAATWRQMQSLSWTKS
jgi:hypothetical protein